MIEGDRWREHITKLKVYITNRERRREREKGKKMEKAHYKVYRTIYRTNTAEETKKD